MVGLRRGHERKEEFSVNGREGRREIVEGKVISFRNHTMKSHKLKRVRLSYVL